MKQLFLFLFIIPCFTANAKNYYISSVSGNDANSGISATTPWKTINKLNSSFAGLLSGDVVLFNRGETFYGSIIVTKSGSSGNPIAFGAYGTGANPIITGFTTVSSWTNLGSNIWESTSAVSTLKDMNCVVINNVNTAMGRFPNTGYFTTNSHVGTTSITSSSITGTPNWTGADVVMRTWNFSIARNLITANSGSTLTYNHTTVDNGHDGYGFFIENDARTLDVQNEWYYNPSTKKIRIYSTSSPTNVQASTADTLVYMVTKSYLTFDGIDFTGSNRRAFYIGSCSGVTIQNCNFNYHGLYAIWGGNNHGSSSSNFNFNHNTLNHINSQAIVLQNEFVNPYIGYNTFNNCGVLSGMFKKPIIGASQWYGAYGSILCIKTNGLIVEYNSVDSTGYTAIHFTGNNTRINNNEVSKHCLLLMDGGGIYTWTGPSGTPTTGSKIYNNIVHDGYGNNEGTTEPNRLCQGLYLDENTRNTEVYSNTSFNNPYGGIFSNANTNCNIHNNTCYNNTIDQILFSNNYNSTQESERLNIVKNNIFFSRTATQYVAKYSTKTNDIDQFFSVCDSNYYCRPIDENKNFYTNINNAAWGYYSLAQWQPYIVIHDIHSKKAPKTITDVNDLRIEYNATTANKTVSLDGNYIDAKNVSYNGTITLAPYTSAVLIRNGVATNQSPTAKAGTDQTIKLPTSSVSLSGSGTDPDGTVDGYAWTKISGPASGTITTATSAATTVTGLVQGVYQFQLKVTDNKGSTGLDNIQITVNAASGLLPAVNPANCVNGLDYKYYETGSGWSVLPIFSTLTPAKTGTTATFDISLANRSIAFAFNFTGFINVPSDGQYIFYTTSDDGSNLYIDNVLVVNNDGVHGAIEKSGTIGLQTGKHAISVGYFQQGGGSVLTVSYSGTGVSRQVVPASALYRISTGGVALNNNINQTISSSTQVGIKAYPNPFAGYIEINITDGVAGKYKLMLVDASGKVLWTKSGIKNIGAFQLSVNTSALERGIYFLKIIQNNTNSVIKLVK